jgi:DNA-binding NarL/FixJ family response regulator
VSPEAPTLVGRGEALSALDAALAGRRPGRAEPAAPGVLLLTGEAGMGKSRLAAEAAARARADGRAVRVGRTSALDAGLTLGVLQDALRTADRAGEPGPVTDDRLAAALPALVLPELGGGPGGGAADRAVLFEACTRHLRALAAGRGAVLVLEDLHWADATSHALVHALARALRGDPVLVVGTLREEERPPSLRDLLRELSRERLAHLVTLTPLDEGEVAQMVTGLTGAAPPEAALGQIARRSGGNPFVVEEMVRESIACGCVDLRTGRWADRAVLPLPATVQDVVAARVERLAPGERALLEAAAVAGERFDLDLAAATAGMDEGGAIAAAGALLGAGLVREDGEALAFRHAITREAVLAGMLAAERRRLHLAALRAGERLGAPPDVLAAHAVAGGDRAAGFAASREAAARSLAIGGAAEARDHLERARGLWDPDDGMPARAAVLRDLGRALWTLGEHAAARAALAEARGIMLAAGDRVGAALALVDLGQARGDAGERRAGIQDLEVAVAELGPDAPVVARMGALARLARALMMAGRMEAAVATADAGLALAGDPPSPGEQRERVHLLATRGGCAVRADQMPAGRDDLRESLEVAEALGDAAAMIRALQNLASSLQDDPAEALALTARGVALARERGLRTHEIWLLNLSAGLHAGAGDLGAAERDLASVDALRAGACGAEYAYEGVDADVGRTVVALVRGDAEAAVAVARRAVAGADRIGDSQLVWPARAGLARGLTLLGRHAEAREALAPAVADALAEPGPVCSLPDVVLAALERAALAHDLGGEELERLTGLGDRTPPAIAAAARAFADLARGRAPRPGALAGAVADLDAHGWAHDVVRIGALGAEGMAACGADPEEAAGLAQLALDRAAAMGATGWERRAAAALRGLGRRAAARADAAGREGLTGREVEVLRLVADGMTNREVGERLVISEATAARHVANLFRKLGVHSRAEAARLAAERGMLVGG